MQVPTNKNTKRYKFLVTTALYFGVTLTSHVQACQGDNHTWTEQSSTQYLFKGKDTCGGKKTLKLEHNGYEIPIQVSADGTYETLVAMGDGRNSVFIITTKGDYIPIMDSVINLQKSDPKLIKLAKPVQQDDDASTFAQIQNDKSDTINDPKTDNSIDPASWSRLNDVDIDVSAMVEAEKKKPLAIKPKEKFFTVEMTWSTPVDLDLHIFEPSFSANAAINAQTTGHVWAKAPLTLSQLAYGELQEFEKVALGETRKEVYHLKSVDGKIPAGAYQVKIDYRDRTIRRNAEPMTCGKGVYASPKATLRIKTGDFDTTKEFTIPAIECGSALIAGKVLSNVGTIQLQ
ncbi:MAG: hypothetical protein ACPGVN_08995 [Alphaproteobacteria bacterium]